MADKPRKVEVNDLGLELVLHLPESFRDSIVETAESEGVSIEELIMSAHSMYLTYMSSPAGQDEREAREKLKEMKKSGRWPLGKTLGNSK